MTMKKQKTLQHIAAVAVVLLALCLVFATPVGAEATDGADSFAEGHVAKVGDKYYTTLTAAVNAVPTDGTQTTVTLLTGVEHGKGVSTTSGQNVIIDFGYFTYNAGINPLAGSPGTVSQAFNLAKGSTVTLKNGTISSSEARMLIQNYANLIIENMILDGSNLRDLDNGVLDEWTRGEYAEVDGEKGYYYTKEGESQKFCKFGDRITLSTNNGTVKIVNSTIQPKTIGETTAMTYNHKAIAIGWAPDSYPDGTQVEIFGGDHVTHIQGNISFGFMYDSENDVSNVKSTLTIHDGWFSGSLIVDDRFGESLTDNIDVRGGFFEDETFNSFVDSANFWVRVLDGTWNDFFYEVSNTCTVNAHYIDSEWISGDEPFYDVTYNTPLASFFEDAYENFIPTKFYKDAQKIEEYEEGAVISSDMEVYVGGWEPIEYEIIFHANNASDVTKVQTFTVEDESVTLEENSFIYDEHFFVGWNVTSAEGTAIDYFNGDSFTNIPAMIESAPIDLYAVWEVAEVDGVPIEANYNPVTGNTTADFDGITAEDIIDEPDFSGIANSTTIELDGVQLTIIFHDLENSTAFAESPDTLNAPLLGALVSYPYGSASVNGDQGSITHWVAFEMSNLTSIPTIDGTFNADIESQITEKTGGNKGIVAMISATGADNTNITEVGVLFYLPMSIFPTEDAIKGFHVKSDGTVIPLTKEDDTLEIYSLDLDENGTNDTWGVELVGDGFSSYAVGYVEPSVTPTPTPSTPPATGGNGGGSSSGTTVKPDTPTEVPPTEDPTDDPSDVPGEDLPDIPDVPVTPEEPSSPAPLLAVLAGLGAAVVLRRK